MSSATEYDCDVLILGASFAGVEVLYQLVRLSGGRTPSVMVVDRQDEHGYLPLVQERLCQRIAPEQTRLRTKAFVESVGNASYVQAEVTGFDVQTHAVTLEDGRILRGRTVVVALGSIVEPPAAMGALLPYKTRAQFEVARAALAERLTSASDGEPPAVVVVGGGVSGVELAGELADLARTRPAGWTAPRVTLCNAGPRLLPDFAPRVSDTVTAALRAQAVDVRLGARVTGASAGVVTIEEGGASVEIPAALALWAAGLRPNPVLSRLGLPLTDDGWLAVGPTLQCFPTPKPTHAEIFGCGDAVRVVGGEGPWPTMQRAIEAIWQAQVVAANVLTLLQEKVGYPDGVPPLRPHRLRETFFYGLSVGARSYVQYRGIVIHVPLVTHWFRRWLMRQYFDRYRPLNPVS